jgi:hypothetical protein
MRWGICAVALALPFGCGCMPLVFGDACRFQDAREASVRADGASGVRIVARAGDLRVNGRTGLTEAEVSGTACGSTRAALESVRLVAERRGPLVWIEADIPDHDFPSQQRRLDLVIELPKSLPIEISDSSGDVEVRDVASLKLDDSSGDIDIFDVAGRLEVEDSSGDITLERIGEASIDDSSGDMEIHGAAGTVRIRDRSGDIDVAGVKGDLIVEQDGSGKVHYRDVQGTATVPQRR